MTTNNCSSKKKRGAAANGGSVVEEDGTCDGYGAGGRGVRRKAARKVELRRTTSSGEIREREDCTSVVVSKKNPGEEETNRVGGCSRRSIEEVNE